MSEPPSSKVYTADHLESSWGNDPLNYSVRAFAAFLQTIWEEAPRGSFHWTPSAEETEIVISEENPVHVDVVEKKPVISLVLGPIRFNGSTLDDLVGMQATDGTERHTDLLPGNMTLNCLSRVPQECRFIAWQSARMIWILRKLFIREAGIQELGRNIHIGSVTPAGAMAEGDTEGEWHSVAVTIPFYLQWSDKVRPLSTNWDGSPVQTLQNISTSYRLRLAAGGVPAVDPNLVQGRPAWGAMTPGRNQQGLRPAMIRGRVIPAPQPAPPAKVIQKSKV